MDGGTPSTDGSVESDAFFPFHWKGEPERLRMDPKRRMANKAVQPHMWEEETGRTLVPRHTLPWKRVSWEIETGWKGDPRPFQTKVHPPLPPPWMTSKGDTPQRNGGGAPPHVTDEEDLSNRNEILCAYRSHWGTAWRRFVERFVHRGGSHLRKSRGWIPSTGRDPCTPCTCFLRPGSTRVLHGWDEFGSHAWRRLFFVLTWMSHAQQGKGGFVSCHASPVVLLPFGWHSIVLVVESTDPSMCFFPSVRLVGGCIQCFRSVLFFFHRPCSMPPSCHEGG